jgi:drug/metabolite transporter (DMT)-like permease
MQLDDHALGILLALLAPLAWSVAVIFFRRAGSLPPLSMNLFKNVMAIVLLLLTMAVLGIGFPTDRSAEDWLRLCGSGLIGLAVADTLLFEGLRRIGAARLAVVDTVYAPTVVLLSWLLLGEQPGGWFLVGAALVVGGVTLASVRASGGPAPDKDVALGMLLAWLAITGTSIGVVLAKPALAEADLVEATCTRLIAGVAGMVPWIVLRGRGAEAITAFRPSPVWWSLIPGTLIGTYLSLMLWLGGFKWASASTAAVLNQLATVYMLVLARVVLREDVTRRQAVGAGVAAAGALVVVLAR